MRDSISKKKKNHKKKRADGVAQGVGPEFKSQYCKKKKRGGASNEEQGCYRQEKDRFR
jgi:hypothetical protein